MKISIYSIFFLFALFSINGFAQNDETRTTRLDFEDELISGDVSSPDLLLILRNKNPRYEVVRGEND